MQTNFWKTNYPYFFLFFIVSTFFFPLIYYDVPYRDAIYYLGQEDYNIDKIQQNVLFNPAIVWTISLKRWLNFLVDFFFYYNLNPENVYVYQIRTAITAVLSIVTAVSFFKIYNKQLSKLKSLTLTISTMMLPGFIYFISNFSFLIFLSVSFSLWSGSFYLQYIIQKEILNIYKCVILLFLSISIYPLLSIFFFISLILYFYYQNNANFFHKIKSIFFFTFFFIISNILNVLISKVTWNIFSPKNPFPDFNQWGYQLQLDVYNITYKLKRYILEWLPNELSFWNVFVNNNVSYVVLAIIFFLAVITLIKKNYSDKIKLLSNWIYGFTIYAIPFSSIIFVNGDFQGWRMILPSQSILYLFFFLLLTSIFSSKFKKLIYYLIIFVSLAFGHYNIYRQSYLANLEHDFIKSKISIIKHNKKIDHIHIIVTKNWGYSYDNKKWSYEEFFMPSMSMWTEVAMQIKYAAKKEIGDKNLIIDRCMAEIKNEKFLIFPVERLGYVRSNNYIKENPYKWDINYCKNRLDTKERKILVTFETKEKFLKNPFDVDVRNRFHNINLGQSFKITDNMLVIDMNDLFYQNN